MLIIFWTDSTLFTYLFYLFIVHCLPPEAKSFAPAINLQLAARLHQLASESMSCEARKVNHINHTLRKTRRRYRDRLLA